MEYKTLRQLDLKIGDIIEDDQGKRGLVWGVEKDSIKATYPDGNYCHCNMDIAKYKKTDTAPEADNIERAVQVGDVYERLDGPQKGAHWEVVELFDYTSNHKCRCIKSTEIDFQIGRELGFVVKNTNDWKFLYNVNDQATTESEHPEKWHPKDGETVWNKVYKNKAKIVTGQNGHIYYMFFDKDGIECISPNFERYREQFDPYTNQDAKIDFSVAGQWVTDGKRFIKTTGSLYKEKSFWGIPLGDDLDNTYPLKCNWKLLTPEQMQPILHLIKNI